MHQKAQNFHFSEVCKKTTTYQGLIEMGGGGGANAIQPRSGDVECILYAGHDRLLSQLSLYQSVIDPRQGGFFSQGFQFLREIIINDGASSLWWRRCLWSFRWRCVVGGCRHCRMNLRWCWVLLLRENTWLLLLVL